MKKEGISIYQAFLMLKDENEVKQFLKDLCTPQEIEALKERWRASQLLFEGELSYRQIHEKTGASVTTISRVARFLKDEPYKGYQLVLDRIKKGTK
jgi:TrpR-related protein YerC/YecD